MGSDADSDGDRRRARLRALLPPPPAGEWHAAAFLARLCELAVGEVGVDGGAVVLMTSVPDGLAGHRTIVGAAGDLAEPLEGLQLTTGEGPCLEVLASDTPVLVADVRSEQARWPGYAAEAADVGARALFSFPLVIGAVRLGTFDLYRRAAGPLDREQFAAALVLGELATETLLAGADRPDFGWLPDVHTAVHQATGMIAAATRIPVAEALLRLRAHAFARGEPIDEVARRVIGRDLVLDETTETPDSPGPPP